MWNNNGLAQLLKIQMPLIQAPMAGGVTTPELVAAVSNAGALGSLGAGYMTAIQIKEAIVAIRKLTNKPFAVNLFIPNACHAADEQITSMQAIIRQVAPELNLENMSAQFPELPSFKEQMQVIIDEKVPVFSFTFGMLAQPYIKQLKENKTIIIGTATTVLEAKLLEENDIDIIVAQGSEAGGHRGTFLMPIKESLVGLNALIPQIRNSVKIPVVAAGAIMDSKSILSALTLGANGVQMGTAFLTTDESGIHPKYKEALINTKSDNTVLTKSFTGKIARAIKNTFITRMEEYADKILDYPIQGLVTQDLRKKAVACNNPEFLFMLSGQSAYLCRQISAQALIDELNKSMTDVLKHA